MAAFVWCRMALNNSAVEINKFLDQLHSSIQTRHSPIGSGTPVRSAHFLFIGNEICDETSKAHILKTERGKIFFHPW